MGTHPEDQAVPKLPRWKRVPAAAWPALLALLWLQPQRNTPVRLLLLLGVALLWGGLLAQMRGRRGARAAYLAATGVVAAFGLLPGRPYDHAALRRAYVRALLSYEGTAFRWGGETRLGMDCSGLVRSGLIGAARAEGLRTANPALLRLSLGLWLRDGSARELGHGYHGRLRFLFAAPSLNALDYALLQPGDVAVTAGGGHCLVYLGDHTWLQASQPRTRRVPAPAKDRHFAVRMKVLRWRVLECR